jgi:hypothetical protein
MALALSAAGCGQSYAPQNPLADNEAPSTASCPDRFNFEPPQTLAGWSAPTWPGGLLGYQIVGNLGYCGTHSMQVDMDLGGPSSKSVEIAYYFPQLQLLNGAAFSLWVYFPQAPPAALTLNTPMVSQNLSTWNSPAGAKQNSFSAGWNHVTGPVTVMANGGAAGLILDFSSGTVPFQGSAWIDEINW